MKASLFVKEIVIVLIVKIFLLTLIWWICFSHPVGKATTHKTLINRLLGTQDGR